MGDNIALGYMDDTEVFSVTNVHWNNNEPLSDIAVYIALNGFDEWENQIEAFQYASNFNSFRYKNERSDLFSGILFKNNANIEVREHSSEVDRLESDYSYIVSTIDDENFEVLIYRYNILKKRWKFKISSIKKHLIKFIFSEQKTVDYRAIYEKY